MYLQQLFNSYTQLSNEAVALINQNTTTQIFKINDSFIQNGQHSNEIGFIISEVFRYYFYDSEGKKLLLFLCLKMNLLVMYLVFLNTVLVKEP